MCGRLGLRSAFVLFASVVFLFAQSDDDLGKRREDMVRTQLATSDWGVEAVRDPLLATFKHIATMDAGAPAPLPEDATLDVAGAIAHLERIGDTRLADRLRSTA